MSDAVGQVTYEFIRKHLKTLDKRALLEELVGFRYAEQSIRAVQRLHTTYANQRGELDNSKYGLFLYPNEKWSEPLFYYTGLGADHASGVTKGYSLTIDPSAASTIRLYESCTLPKLLTLPEHLRCYAHEWDVAGADALVATDNGPEMRNRSVGLMFLMLWTILLFMPPRRPDYKGTVERRFGTLEDQFISALPGYVAARDLRITDPRYDRVLQRAKAGANMTVKDFEKELVPALLEGNRAPHPRFKCPRIEVYREAQAFAPLLMPAGSLLLKSIFSLTFQATLTREGVQVERFKYQSDELSLLFRGYTGPVHVKLPPNDIRSVLVFAPKVREPIEAHLTSLDVNFPVTIELARLVARRIPENTPPEEFAFNFLHDLSQLQRGAIVLQPGERQRSVAQAATHASNVPPIAQPSAKTESDTNLDSLLVGTEMDRVD